MNQVDRNGIEQWIGKARKTDLVAHIGNKEKLAKIPGAGELVYISSVHAAHDLTFCLLKSARAAFLGIFGKEVDSLGFEGKTERLMNDVAALFCPLNHNNAVALRKTLPYTAPSTLRNCTTTLGLGDRLGLAGAGHIRGVKPFKVAPVLAQLSVRELNLTNRTHENLLDAATWFVFQEGYSLPWGADGDHLKTEDMVRKAASLGFTMITADVSDYFRSEFEGMMEGEISNAYGQIAQHIKLLVEKEYSNRTIELDTGQVLSFSEIELAKLCLVYWDALGHAETLYRAAVEVKGNDNFDFELSIDEVDRPTTPLAHAFVACELVRRGMKVFSVAPRFVGEFQKGIDYIGDIEEFETTFKMHAAIARRFGYKISIHSGSDKFSVYPIIAKYTEGRVHIKTAGTYWLEAVTLVAREDPKLYRRLHTKAMESFERARQYYQVSTDTDKIPALAELKDEQLPVLLANPDARQLIHISYGELLRDPDLGEQFFEFMENHIEEYWGAVKLHVEKHYQYLHLE